LYLFGYLGNAALQGKLTGRANCHFIKRGTCMIILRGDPFLLRVDQDVYNLWSIPILFYPLFPRPFTPVQIRACTKDYVQNSTRRPHLPPTVTWDTSESPGRNHQVIWNTPKIFECKPTPVAELLRAFRRTISDSTR
jgi:hypothetical protein